jgi:hypothetical protein
VPLATSTPPAMSMPGQERTGGEAQNRLLSRPVQTPPAIDGQVEAIWEAAEPFSVPLTWGAEGTAHALDVELRALHDEQQLYLLAQWPGAPPDGEQETVYNQFTLHWRIPEPDAARLDCNVACHTVFADGRGRVAYANTETIPVGRGETLQIAGGWQAGGPQAGTWTLEWSRPLVNGNPFDLQLDDQDRAYVFRVKIFARAEGKPDPISKPHRLVFAP